MFTRLFSLVAAVLIAALSIGSAQAATSVLTLTRNSLSIVTDSSGSTQYETGAVTTSTGTSIGYYNVTRRFITAGGIASVLNAASETMTIALATASASVYENITLEGVHNYSSGAFAGSVSAASTKYNFAFGAKASATIPSSGITLLTLVLKGAKTIP